MPFGANHKPKIIKAATIIIGIKLGIINDNGMPAVKPPANKPKGIVIIPLKTPVAKNCWSSFWIMPSATGIVKTNVGPIIAPKIAPANKPACGSLANCCANAKPPISLANKVVANIAGSAPSNS